MSPVSNDAIQAHWERTRKGLLKFVGEQPGPCDLTTLHSHSEREYFVGHRKFSEMMEELVGEGLLAVDHTSETASLTDKGRQAL